MNMTAEVEEVFIYKSQGTLVKVTLNHLARTCIACDTNGDVLIALKNVSPKRLLEIKRQINAYIARQKKLIGFSNKGVYYL